MTVAEFDDAPIEVGLITPVSEKSIPPDIFAIHRIGVPPELATNTISSFTCAVSNRPKLDVEGTVIAIELKVIRVIVPSVSVFDLKSKEEEASVTVNALLPTVAVIGCI
jgi:hypothetical protein